MRLNTNENTTRCPTLVVEAILAALADDLAGLNRYPDREFTELRKALTAYLEKQSGVSVTPDQLWAGNGSNEVLSHVVQAFGGPGRTALGFTPATRCTRSSARRSARRGSTGWGHRRAGHVRPHGRVRRGQARRHQPSIVFLCSPNNPTGTALPFEVIGAVLDAAPDAVVVVDEAYAEFARPGTPSALTLLADNPRLVVTRTMSKAFAFAGGRLGYLVASCRARRRAPARASALPPSSPDPDDRPGRARARRAHARPRSRSIKAQRDRIVEELAAAGATPVASDSTSSSSAGCRREGDVAGPPRPGMLVRDVGIGHHLRVTAGTPEETTVPSARRSWRRPGGHSPRATHPRPPRRRRRRP